MELKINKLDIFKVIKSLVKWIPSETNFLGTTNRFLHFTFCGFTFFGFLGGDILR